MMKEQISAWFAEIGVASSTTDILAWMTLALAVILLAVVTDYVTKKILLRILSYFVRKTPTKWDDYLLKQKFFARLAHLAPALVFYIASPIFGEAQAIVERASLVYMLLIGMYVFSSFLNATVDIYRGFDISRQRPIKGYAQIVKIIVAVFVTVISIALLLNRSPWLLLSGMGAMTAVLLLVFKDSILGLVASIQLSMNDMIRVGDWVEMPKYGADGDVIDISLHTVKIQNWDKTIATIPTYAFVSESFKNWRGMEESGGRRIKRAINIDMNSVRFCTEEMLKRFEKFQYIADYIRTRKEEIGHHNEEKQVDTNELVNGRHLTNIGTFRAYLVNYLKNHPRIHQNMTFLVRHLPPTEHGLPIQIYVFSNDQEWVNYEAIQADIFDHILAVIPEFDLCVFQNPTGSDFRQLRQER